jgi:ribosomal protein S11
MTHKIQVKNKNDANAKPFEMTVEGPQKNREEVVAHLANVCPHLEAVADAAPADAKKAQ